jgi:probable aminopeptidase NPEPL1
VGPLSTRPDDVQVFYSGKTVEVNNTDAEGRLVLADGCSFASKHLNPKIIIDIATLTGAQGIATGKRHAAIYCNDEWLEDLAVRVGRESGDLTHPLPYCPEFFKPEFASAVADMKNSVKDRSNAQSACAGQFIGNHIEVLFNL